MIKNTFVTYFDSQESVFGCSHPLSLMLLLFVNTFKSMKLLNLQLTNFSRVGMKLGFMIIYCARLESIETCSAFGSCVFCFLFFFLSAAAGDSGYCSMNSSRNFLTFSSLYHINGSRILFMGPTNITF